MLLLTLDIGGTSVKMGLVNEQGEILARDQADVSFDGYATPILDTVQRAAQDFIGREKAAIAGVGVSATGQIDTARGIVAGTNGKIPHYEGSPIKEALEKQFGVPVWVLNDANAAALGECFLGAGQGFRDVLMITLGTGVGGGLVLNGRIYGGARGLAGELGHFTLYQDGMPCPCGKRGCFESYASASALVRRAGMTSGKAVFAAVEAGDEKAAQALDRWLDDVAAGLTGLIHIFNPQLVLIGGGVSVQEELLMKPLREKVMSTVMPRFGENLLFRRATLGNDAGMLGALRFWLDQEGRK